ARPRSRWGMIIGLFLVRFGFAGQLAEVLLDDVPVVSREILADLLQRFLSLPRREIAPTALVADRLFGHFARALAPHGGAVLSRALRLDAPLLAGGGGGGRGRLLLLLDLLDHLVERGDHAVLDFAHLGTSAAQVEPAANVFHAAGDVVERVVLQGL